MAPNMILCDVMMPDMDGPTLLVRLRESPETTKIPVVFMTARAQTSELEQLKRLGAVAVLTKPFDPMTLAASVRNELNSVKSDAIRYNFADRMRTDAAALARYRKTLSDAPEVLGFAGGSAILCAQALRGGGHFRIPDRQFYRQRSRSGDRCAARRHRRAGNGRSQSRRAD